MGKYVIWTNGNMIPFERLAFEFHLPEDLLEGYLQANYPSLEIVSDEEVPAVPEPEAPVESGDGEPAKRPLTGFFGKDNSTQKGVNE